MAFDSRRAFRGAIAGAIAAGAWAAQQRADIALFGVDYDDTELLGKVFTQGEGSRPIGLALHIANGAAFGAVYAIASKDLPGPGWLKGTAAGMAENLATWPLVGLVERVHPARDELPELAGDPAAFAQATWRHVLFGALMGELEARFNREDSEAEFAEYAPHVSSNGHGEFRGSALTDQG